MNEAKVRKMNGINKNKSGSGNANFKKPNKLIQKMQRMKLESLKEKNAAVEHELIAKQNNNLPKRPSIFDYFISELDYLKMVNIKRQPNIESERVVRPFHGQGCNCTPFSLRGFYSKEIPLLRQRNCLLVKTSNYDNFIITRKCCYIMHCLRLKNFRYPYISDKKIISSDKVAEAVESFVTEELSDNSAVDEKRANKLRNKQQKSAVVILKKMKADISTTLINLTGYILFKVFNWMFSSISITEGQMQMIEAASKRNLPIIYMPLHKSHIDYLFVTWILHNRDLPAPLVAAGDNLRLPIFGSLLRGLGGFFIKRRIASSRDSTGYVYRAVLQSYINEALSAGYNLEFFIEGGRTRTGKPCMPKGGLLSIVVDAFLSGALCDVLIVPIAISYDKLIDGHFTTEQLGKNKVPESFWGAVCAILKTLWTNFGHARVDFSQPFSLKEYFESIQAGKKSEETEPVHVKGHQRSASSPLTKEGEIKDISSLYTMRSRSSIFGAEVTDDYRKFIEKLGLHIVYNAEQCQAIMSTNAVAYLLSFKHRNGTTLEKLSESLEELKRNLFRKERDTGFSGDAQDVVLHAIELLGDHLVQTTGDIYTLPSSEVIINPILEIPNVLELNYYANAVLPVFAIDCMVATSIRSMLECDLEAYINVATNFKIGHTTVINRTLRLAEFLNYEFILIPPCKDLSQKVNNALEEFIIDGFLQSAENEEPRRRRYSDSDSDDDREREALYNLCPTYSSVAKVNNLTKALSPIIEAYYATACNLIALINNPMSESDFVNSTQNFVFDLIDTNTLSYGESSAADPIKNAVRKFESDKVLFSFTENSSKYVQLNKEFENESCIFDLAKEIEWYRI